MQSTGSSCWNLGSDYIADFLAALLQAQFPQEGIVFWETS